MIGAVGQGVHAVLCRLHATGGMGHGDLGAFQGSVVLSGHTEADGIAGGLGQGNRERVAFPCHSEAAGFCHIAELGYLIGVFALGQANILAENHFLCSGVFDHNGRVDRGERQYDEIGFDSQGNVDAEAGAADGEAALRRVALVPRDGVGIAAADQVIVAVRLSGDNGTLRVIHGDHRVGVVDRKDHKELRRRILPGEDRIAVVEAVFVLHEAAAEIEHRLGGLHLLIADGFYIAGAATDGRGALQADAACHRAHVIGHDAAEKIVAALRRQGDLPQVVAGGDRAVRADLRRNAACAGAADRAQVVALGDVAVGDITRNAAGVVVLAGGHAACVIAAGDGRSYRRGAECLSADAADIGGGAADGGVVGTVFHRG